VGRSVADPDHAAIHGNRVAVGTMALPGGPAS